MSQWVNSLNLGPTTFLLIFIGLLIVLGTVLDVSSAILLLTPVFLPAAQSAGVSPIVFGIVFVGTLAIGAYAACRHLPQCLLSNLKTTDRRDF